VKRLKKSFQNNDCGIKEKVEKMRKYNKIIMAALLLIPILWTAAFAQQPSGLQYKPNLKIQVWTNKGDGNTFYRGEDLVVYFRANMDCYALVYEIDSNGNINVLFPENPHGDNFITADRTYRIPPLNADYRMEVGGAAGDEYVYAVASPTRFDAPEWMLYWGREYNYIDDDWITDASSGRNNTLNDIINRLSAENGGYYVSDFASFNIEPRYRNYFYHPASYYHYRYGSLWIGTDYPGCEVYIDGVFYGVGPLYIPSILMGGHAIILYYNGFPCWQDYVWIDYGRYYRISASIEYRYIRYTGIKVRYKYWANWDFGGKKYRRPERYKRFGGYTYKHPETVWVAAKSKTTHYYKRYYKNGEGAKYRSPIVKKYKGSSKYRNASYKYKTQETKGKIIYKDERKGNYKSKGISKSGYEEKGYDLGKNKGKEVYKKEKTSSQKKVYEKSKSEKSTKAKQSSVKSKSSISNSKYKSSSKSSKNKTGRNKK